MKRAVDREALTVAMAVVPGIYSRNKYFSLYEDPEVRRARSRAALVRGVVRQLSGVLGEVSALTLERSETRVDLRYRIDSVRLDRRVQLTPIEAACLVYLAARAGVRGLHANDADRATIDSALRRLAVGLRLSSVEAGNADVSLP